MTPGAYAPAPPLHRPIQSGRDGKTQTRRQRIDHEIFQPGMPARHPELQDFEHADHDDGDRRRQQPALRVGEPEGQADQNEGECVLAVLTEIGVRPVAGAAPASRR